MADLRLDRALGVLAALASGTVPADSFTEDARWWWNGGLDIPVDEFRALIADLHTQTVGGIVVTPGLTMQDADTLMVEATSDAPLINGSRYNNRYVFLFAFAGDRIRQVREYSDSAHVQATFDLG